MSYVCIHRRLAYKLRVPTFPLFNDTLILIHVFCIRSYPTSGYRGPSDLASSDRDSIVTDFGAMSNSRSLNGRC